MAILSALFNCGQTNHYSQVFPGTRDCTSAAMQKAIEDWFSLYYAGKSDEKEDPCQRLPVAVVSKLQKACFGEYAAQITAKGAKADYMIRCQQALDKQRKRAVQLAMIGGEAWLKPIPARDRMLWSVVRRDAVAILARNTGGEVTDMVTSARTAAQGGVYTLLERRTMNANGYLTIINKLFFSQDGNTLGRSVPLDSLDQYDQMQSEYTFQQPVGSIGLVSLRMPMENTVDGSMDGVSVYAPAAELIHRINHNEYQLNQEFELGAFRIFASSDLIKRKSGKSMLPDGLFVGIDDDPKNTGITEFAPQLREESFLARKNEYLRNVESVLGIKRGLLCETADVQRTATEVASSAGDYSLTVQDLWEVWEKADREALRLCDVLGQMYRICPAGAFDPAKDVAITWGNGVLYDPDQDLAEEMEMVAAGMLRPEYPLAKKYNLPRETEEDLAQIREKYMPKMEQLLGPDTGEE